MSIASAAKKAVSRRGFLRAMPAVPLAAPSLARDVATYGLNAPVPVGYASTFSTQGPDIDLDYMRQRRADLESVIAGKADEREYTRNNHLVIAHHYDGLRSLSPVMRAKLYDRECRRQTKLEQRHWASWELKDLMKRVFA
jgi:hypothetical protein